MITPNKRKAFKEFIRAFIVVAVSMVTFIAVVSVVNRAEAKQITREWSEICYGIELTAEAIMKARQAGVPMSKMVDITIKSKVSNDGEKRVFLDMIREAYTDHRMWTSDAMKQREIDKFKNGWYSACYTMMTRD